MKKKLTKIVWFGAEKDEQGNPLLPKLSESVEQHLDGLNEGELYLHNDDERPSLFIRTNKDRIVAIGGGDLDYLSNYFLRKDKDDRSKGKISSDKGFEVGNYIRGMIGGQGGYYYKDENGKVILELDKIHAREELIAPKLSFNCIDVVTGELAQTFAYGTIKSVDVENQIATLDLLEDEYGTLHEDDICRGIFHFLNEENNSDYSEDHNRFHNYSGFSTSYFTPTEIITNEKGVMEFRYELQEGTTVHPTTGMNFFAYGNFSDTNRQSVTYQTRDYTRRLVKVDDWTINPDKNIAMQEGLLEGLTIGGMVMHGYGTFESNSYFTGTQIQFTPEQLEEIRGESAVIYRILPDVNVIKVDNNGNPSVNVIKPSLIESKGGSTSELKYTPDGYAFYWSIDGGGLNEVDKNAYISGINVSKATEMVKFVLFKGGSIVDIFIVPVIIDGSKGETTSIFSLNPSTNVIKVDKDGNYSPSEATTTILQRVGSVVDAIETPSDYGYTVKMYIDGVVYEKFTYGEYTSVLNAKESVEFRLFKGGEEVDYEKIPLLYDGKTGDSPIVVDLSNDTISIACDQDGVPTETVSSGSPKTTSLKVYYGLVRKELASLSASSHTGITISTDYLTGLVKVTRITSSAADSTEVTLTAEVEINGEYKVLSKVFTINKIKQGETGQAGGKGDAAAVYSIQPNNLPLSLVGSTVTPSTATFTCYKNTGISTQETETAYWYAYRCNTGNESDYVLFASKESYVASYNVTFSPSYKFYKIVAKPYGGVQTTAYAMYTQDGEGSPGENGYFPRDRGLFMSGERYYYSKDSSTGDIYRDKVVYEIEGTYYNFLVKSRNDNGYITAAPTSATGDSNWEVISQYRALIADTLFGSNANIGGFMATSERLRTSAEVNGKPRFELDGSQGTQTMRQDGGTVWSVNADGVQSIGFEDGERIVLDPNDKSISVFDSNGVQRTNIDGKEYTKSELIVSSGGTFSLSSYASNSSGRSLTSSNALGSIASYSLTSVLTFRYAGVAEVNISNFYMSLYHSARATSTGTPSVIPNGKAYIYLCTYTSSSASTLVSKRLVAYRNVSDATVDGSTTTTDRLSGTFSVSVPSGYHRIEVLMEVTNGSSIGSTTITAYWSLSSAKIVVESYMSRLFANGMMLSKSSDEYFLAMMDGDQMNVEAVTGSSGIRLNNGAIQLKYNNSGWFNMPITLLFARVTVSSGATSGASISYNSYDGSTVSVSSSTEGIFNITIPSSWGVTASNTNIQATAFYRYRGNSNNAVCWAVVNSVSSKSIQVITSYNNNNEFDHSGFYLEVKKFQ